MHSRTELAFPMQIWGQFVPAGHQQMSPHVLLLHIHTVPVKICAFALGMWLPA